MGYNHRKDEIHDNIVRMQRAWEAEREALATVRRYNAGLSAKGYVWFWPKIAAALTAKHPWLVIACEGPNPPRSSRSQSNNRCIEMCGARPLIQGDILDD